MAVSEILPQAGAIAACSVRIADVPDISALTVCAVETGRLAVKLQLADAGPALVTQVLSRLNDAVAARVTALLVPRFPLPDARWCWLGLGSAGRMEQTLVTDQDNGLVFSATANCLDPQQLNEFDRCVLLESFRQARKLLHRLKPRFHIET